MRENVRQDGGHGIVIGTEYEPAKARAARAHFAEAGLSEFIDLREGDLRETLAQHRRARRFRVDRHLDADGAARARADRTAPAPRRDRDRRQHHQFRDAYRDYFAFVNDPANGLRTLTLPFEGGLELTTKHA